MRAARERCAARSAGGARAASSASVFTPHAPRMTLGRTLRAEVVRLRRSPLVPLHAVLAVALGLALGAYFGGAPWDPYLSCDAFFQLLGAGSPLLVGLSCGMAIDAEREAGDCANLLGVPSRRVALAAKGLTLLALGAVAAAVAALLFALVMQALGKPLPSAGALVQAVAGIAAGSVALYAVELAVALRFGRNAAIAVGALGLMVALMCLGGLANGLFTGTFSGAMAGDALAVVPFSWPARLASLRIELAVADVDAVANGAAQVPALLALFKTVAIACGAITAATVAAGLALANRFEGGRRAGE